MLTESRIDFRDTRAFFRYANSRRGDNASISILKEGQRVHSTPLERANHLASHFESVFVCGSPESGTIPEVDPLLPDDELVISEHEICALLLELKGSANATPDKIPQLLYKRFAYFLAEPLNIIFQCSYDKGIVPNYFRRTWVTPIFKKGDKHLASNYRPVAQGCIAAKIFEKLIANHLQTFLTRNKLLNPAQHGFVPHKSTCTQLLSMTQDWAMLINAKKSFHCVYIDQKAAFDRIPHKRLLNKLTSLGVHGKSVSWISVILTWTEVSRSGWRHR